MARIISISNHKGGVGKTTTTACLGAGLASKGYKVLMVDLDAQANLTASFYTPDVQEQLTRTIYDAMVEKANLPIFQLNENLHICPSSLNLSQLEFQLVQAYSRESILKKLLAPLVDHFDFILLDCPPALGLMTINAFVASTEVFIPLVAETLPVKGLKVMDDFLSMVKEDLNPSLDITGIIITRWEGRNLNKILEDSLVEHYGDKVFKTKIRTNIAISETTYVSQDIFEYDNNSNGAKDYSELIKEVLAMKIN